MDELSILRRLAGTNRTLYRSTQVKIQRDQKSAQEANVTILGYDATTGRYQVQDKLGNIILARAISNSAALAIGSQVSLCISQCGIPTIDATPR
ncbi:hypothetical protein Cylst_6405 (plasmid) [Cylindrospermum stagnale PCC 7417]|uniref:Uncharacterized protein n=1 Tax=Cylindrospermum stagnale PCC 7417 TaxID=56107 RepID=K9X6T7_9NOST|nr:hypothetical protein [Cylindrospermum stagnale]AFZ28203.1 hypothetical protein Cylst_6405 [Cylindrospermum stagnale PCC 7417]